MFFSGLFQRKSDAPVTTPAELADAIGLSYDTYIAADAKAIAFGNFKRGYPE